MARSLGGYPSTFFVLAAASMLLLPACISPGEWARMVQENELVHRDKRRLERTVAQRDGTIARLHQQIQHLQGFGPDQPATLFAPIRLEIASLSGGADYDGKPGDDGVTVHLRPRDADGDVVKSPGRITIQLLDHTNRSTPRVLGACVFDEPDELRKRWHGRFGTQHYTLKCPFQAGVELPASRKVVVNAELVDYLTGRTLTAVKEVAIAFPANR